jgi:hypothetical protein
MAQRRTPGAPGKRDLRSEIVRAASPVWDEAHHGAAIDPGRDEYFHGDNGAGLGAVDQTGWTGLIADVIRRRHGAVRSVFETMKTTAKKATA